MAMPQPAGYPSADAGFAKRSPIFSFPDINSVTNFRTDTHKI